MRVLVYDRTCGSLSRTWSAGATLYRGLRRVDAAHGVASWAEAFAWLASLPSPISELQYWGHGKWGAAFVAQDVLDSSALRAGHLLHAPLRRLRAQLAADPLVWFRTCETLGAVRGQAFAANLADFLGARVAGHTFVIGFHQSGLHGLAPGATPDWPADEGLAAGTPASPSLAKPSRPWSPRTITCLTGTIPSGWLAL